MSTRIEVTNGASVTRAWGDGGSEFLACFQYEGDARDYADAKLAEDAERGWKNSFYVVANHSNGHVEIVRHKTEAA